MDELFIKAIRGKYRFSFKGLITVEDLFDLNLKELNTIYKDLSNKIKNSREESLLLEKTKDDEVLEEKIKIIEYIFNMKKKEKEDKIEEANKKAEKEKILRILANKREENLANKTEEELLQMLNNL